MSSVSKARLNCVSLFSGAGGLDIGFERSGFHTLALNEIEPKFAETLRANLGEKRRTDVPISRKPPSSMRTFVRSKVATSHAAQRSIVSSADLHARRSARRASSSRYWTRAGSSFTSTAALSMSSRRAPSSSRM